MYSRVCVTILQLTRTTYAVTAFDRPTPALTNGRQFTSNNNTEPDMMPTLQIRRHPEQKMMSKTKVRMVVNPRSWWRKSYRCILGIGQWKLSGRAELSVEMIRAHQSSKQPAVILSLRIFF